MIKRMTGRTGRQRKVGISALLTLLVALLAVAFVQFPLGTTQAHAVGQTCPGGSSSGTGSDCSNVHNNDLVSERPMPATLFRGDSRLPYTIFNTGFASRGGNNDIVAHVQGDRAGNSNYISTTGTLSVALPFARSQGLRNLESAARSHCQNVQAINQTRHPWTSRFFPSSCGTSTVTSDSYVYVIDPDYARNAVYVPDQIRGNANLYNHYASQDEWAYVHRLPREAIVGVRVYRMTAHANGTLIDTRSITFAYDRFIMNPNYAHLSTLYNNATDPNDNFDASSNLNTPSLPGNPYNRGCSVVNRCRGGGS